MNILWICTDQQRWDTLGVYGNPFVDTPNLDRLAREGVLFEQAYCNSPVCMPSRSSFLTGLYPIGAGVGFNGVEMPEENWSRLVPRLLTDAGGYCCGLSGKLHVSYSAFDTPQTKRMIHHGYSEFNWSPGGSSGVYRGNSETWKGCQYRYWLRDLDVRFQAETHPDCEHVETSMPASLHQTTWCAQRAVTFIETMAKSDVPWMFSCNLFDPHEPFDPPRELLERYKRILDDIPLPRYEPGELDSKPAGQRTAHEGVTGTVRLPIAFDALSDDEHRLIRAAYWAMIDLIDQQVGRMLNALDYTRQRKDTLVIFTSDHGESLGDHGLYKKRDWMYDESMHVPLIMSWPEGGMKGQRVTEFAELVDLAPTILDAAGIDYSTLTMDGHSWWSFLTGKSAPSRDFVYAEVDNCHDGNQSALIRTKTHKLIWRYDTEEGELYDLTEDSPETVNRWDDPQYADIRSQLMNALENKRQELGRNP